MDPYGVTRQSQRFLPLPIGSGHWLRFIGRRGLWCLLGVGAVLLGLNGYVALAALSHTSATLSLIPAHRVGLVFGAGIAPDGRLSPMLADRMDAAIALYQAGQIHKLLLSGDNSRAEYDEVSAMRGYALARGVVAADITLDYAGFSTYESCYRAGAIFGLHDAVVITQRFHLARALYTCEHLGLAVDGYGSPDVGKYPVRVMGPYLLREARATLKALWEVHITRPLPTFLGPREVIS